MQEIVDCYLHRHHTQSDIARLYRISHKLVSNLVIESKKWPGKLRDRKMAEKRKFNAGIAVVDAVEELMVDYKPVTSANLVQSKVLDMSRLKVPRPQIREIMRRECGLKYRRAKKNPTHINSERCLVLRQHYATTMLEFLKSGHRLLNIDETWLNETNFTRKHWCSAKASSALSSRPISPSLSMIAALDSDGRVYFSLGHAATDQDTFMLFMRHLVKQLDVESPGWEDNTVILIDNATYHTGKKILKYFTKMQVPIMYSAPYSFSSAPIESLFAHLKLGELNQAGINTGKK